MPGTKTAIEVALCVSCFEHEQKNAGSKSAAAKIKAFLFIHIPLKSNIVLYIPDTLYDDIYINAGIGKIDITNLYTTNLTLKAGIGEISIDKLNVMNKFILDGGVGEVDIKNAYINSLDLDSGVGNIKLQTILLTNLLHEQC